MQKVAWPMTIVRYDRSTAQKVKKELSAIPVMIPGRASGRMSRNETASRPKKRKRWTAKAAADPSRSEIDVASSAARSESQRASRMSWFSQVRLNHLVESPGIGQPWTFEGLNA